MTIEELRTYLDDRLPPEEVTEVIEAVVTIRSAAYNEGWDDCEND